MRVVTIMALMFVVLACSAPTETISTPTPAVAVEVTPLEFERVVPEGTIHALENPEVVPASEAAGHVRANEMVMGLKIGDESRAYPIGLMRRYELANDVVGGEPVAITFCPSCNIGLAFSRTVDDHALTFDVTGMLLDTAMVMKDREEGTLWSQSRLQALDGAMAGTKLRLLVTNQMSWEQWKAENPDTTLVIDPRVPPKVNTGFELPVVPTGDELKPDSYHGYVAGVTEGETAAAFPFPVIEDDIVVNGAVGDMPVLLVASGNSDAVVAWARTVDGQILTFAKDGKSIIDEETKSAWNPITGIAESGPLAGTQLTQVEVWVVDWQGWLNAYPDTQLNLLS